MNVLSVRKVRTMTESKLPKELPYTKLLEEWAQKQNFVVTKLYEFLYVFKNEDDCIQFRNSPFKQKEFPYLFLSENEAILLGYTSKIWIVHLGKMSNGSFFITDRTTRWDGTHADSALRYLHKAGFQES